MQFGTFLLLQSPSARPSQEIFARGTQLAQTADELGFDSIWCAEHHFSTYGYLSRPLMYALHLAKETDRIRVGSAVVVVPLHHPLIIAEEIATADLLCGGRLDVGLGRGYQRYEFERLGHDLSESRGRWEEGVDILLKAFKGQPFSYRGEYFKFGETTVFPVPQQRPHPPIWVVGQSPESIAATLKRGFNLVCGGFGVSIDQLREFRQGFDALVEQEKLDASKVQVSIQRAVYVTESEAEARAAVEEARWNMRVTLSLRHNREQVERGHAIAVPFDGEPQTADLLERYLVIGTPQTCVKRLQALQQAMGINHFNASFWFGDMAHEQVVRSMRLFAQEVIPHFR